MHNCRLVFRNFHHLKGTIARTYCQKRYYHFLKASVQSANNVLSPYTNTNRTTRGCHGDVEYKPSSALFVSGKSEAFSPFLTVDLDLEDRLKDIDLLKKNIAARGLQDVVDLEVLVSQYKQLSEFNKEKSSMSIGKWKIRLKEIRNDYWDVTEQVMLKGLKLPNYLHPDTPETLEVLEQIGSQVNAVAKSDSHISIAQKYKLIKFSDIGKKAYFMQGDLAMLEQTLLSYVCNKLTSKGYVQAHITEFFRTLPVEGAGIDFTDTDQIYLLEQKVEGKHVDNLPMTGYFARGVSLVTFAAIIAKKIYKSSCLPLHYFVSGRSYLTESAQEKLPGLFGALQTMKVETMSLCENVDTAETVYKQYWEEICEMYKLFNCPIRLVKVPANSLQPSEQMRSEVQMWAPSIQNYIKVASVSMIGDYLSRRLMCRHGNKKKKDYSLIYMVHSEVLDVTRLIALLMEYGDVSDEGASTYCHLEEALFAEAIAEADNAFRENKFKFPELSFLEDSFSVKHTKT